jgi:diguanylate cyclase (GGDEF)-like protein/PAS domain S-box-containing protein
VLDDAFHKSLVDHLAEGVYYVDRRRCIQYWNLGATNITGFHADEVVGRRCTDGILAHVDEAGRELCRALCPLVASMRADEPREVEVWLRHQDGHRVPVRVRTTPIHDDEGRVVGAVETFDDSSRLLDARAQAAAASRDALSDQLTGLPNRRHLDAALAARLEDLRRYGWPFGLLIADIDHFKDVNDTYGHDVGDAALRSVAATIGGGVRSGDLAGRWGGEEFVVLANGGDERSLGEVGERLRALVASSRVMAAGSELGVRISVGAAAARRSDGPHELLARADAALYDAKAAGRDRVVVAGTQT